MGVNMKIAIPQTIWARQALLPDGWAQDVRLEIDNSGRIDAVTVGAAVSGIQVGTLLPAPANLHSHAFQRAMAGLSEARGPDPRDTFWTWRQLMFRFLDHINPDDMHAIAAMVQMEMLEAGFAAVAEFHYLHHRPDGGSYDNLAEMADSICRAASMTGIGLTLLPVLYRYGGCDRRPLASGQRRFGNTPDTFARLFEQASASVLGLPADCGMGVAPHSLRAVQPEDLVVCQQIAAGRVIHMHLAEQLAEVDEVQQTLGARPVEWLLANAPVDERWCLIHCTQTTPVETLALARSGAVAGLCPITEASLGDGIFDAHRYLAAGGAFGIGSDSNIRISLNEELRSLEYSQRLRDHNRAILAQPDQSTGNVLLTGAATGGAQAVGRDAGALRVGALADLVALDDTDPDLSTRLGDPCLDTFVFSKDNACICHVWAAGRHVVAEGRHVNRDKIRIAYTAAMKRLRNAM
jgi:formimidoylglutamate deiminase